MNGISLINKCICSYFFFNVSINVISKILINENNLLAFILKTLLFGTYVLYIFKIWKDLIRPDVIMNTTLIYLYLDKFFSLEVLGWLERGLGKRFVSDWICLQ